MVWERSDLRAMGTRVLEMLDGIGVLAGCLELFCIPARGRAERRRRARWSGTGKQCQRGSRARESTCSVSTAG